MSRRSFAVTWDYRCPFARVAHSHVITALKAGAPWDVTFAPFSLNQAHVEAGGTDVWDDPSKRSFLLPMEVGLAVRDRYPDAFPDFHTAMFDARHRESRDLRERDVLVDVIASQGLDHEELFAVVDEGTPLATFRKEHEHVADEHSVFGVPTFIVDDRAVYVRLMRGPKGDAAVGRATVDRILDMLDNWRELNEFKLTTLSR